MNRRRSGIKTEPAFADVLNLSGDPYRALLAIEPWSDDALIGLLAKAGASEPAELQPHHIKSSGPIPSPHSRHSDEIDEGG